MTCADDACTLQRARPVPIPEFDAMLGERRKRAWPIIRRHAPMPVRHQPHPLGDVVNFLDFICILSRRRAE
jgi:hypothetical protein